MSDAMLVEYDTEKGPVKLDAMTVRRYLVSGRAAVSDQEVMMFLNLCRYQRLNPFLREAYLIKYSDRTPATMVVGKDAFTKRAAGIPECEGWNAGVVVQSTERGAAVYTSRKGAAVYEGEKLIGGWAEVYRKGWREALKTEVTMTEYAKFNNEGRLAGNWATMPATMIRKVALVQALRETFPDSFQGMYDSAEMKEVSSENLEEVTVTAEVSEPAESGKPDPVPSEPIATAEGCRAGDGKPEVRPTQPAGEPDRRKEYLEVIRSVLASLHDQGEPIFHREEEAIPLWQARKAWSEKDLQEVIVTLRTVRTERANNPELMPGGTRWHKLTPDDVILPTF